MLKIIFEDEHIMVVDKPAGVPCLPAKDGKKDTIAEMISKALCHSREGGNLKCVSEVPAYYRGDDKQFNSDRGIVHRLDNETSGCLLVAKDASTYTFLRSQFDEHSVKKVYTALVLGETPPEGIIDVPIVHDPKNKGKMKVTCGNDKLQLAFTTFKTLTRLQHGAYSLLEVAIKTGVRHQIRVHLASIGHPLAGDRLYQNVRQRERDKTGLKRQFLHASLIGLTHPVTKEWMEFKSELPAELKMIAVSFKTDH